MVSDGQASVDELEINEVWAVRADGFQGNHGRHRFKLQGCQSSGVIIMIKYVLAYVFVVLGKKITRFTEIEITKYRILY